MSDKQEDSGKADEPEFSEDVMKSLTGSGGAPKEVEERDAEH